MSLKNAILYVGVVRFVSSGFYPWVMKTWKGVSARLLNQKHRDKLSKVLCEGHIWSPSYYIATTSDNVMDNIKKYIQEQGEEDEKRNKDKIISKW